MRISEIYKYPLYINFFTIGKTIANHCHSLDNIYKPRLSSGYDDFIIMNKKYQVIDIIGNELNELFYWLKHTFLILSRIKYFNIRK